MQTYQHQHLLATAAEVAAVHEMFAEQIDLKLHQPEQQALAHG